MVKLEHRFHEEFSGTAPAPWLTLASGRVAGKVRSAGGDGFTAGNVTFAEVFEAGYVLLTETLRILLICLSQPHGSLRSA